MLVYHVDAFTREPFAGNPAAVCLLSEPRDDSWMGALAVELNLPMTAFVVRDGTAGGSGDGGAFQLRWFNAAGETPLCGHATLAAAHVLWETAAVRPAEPIRFLTASGTLHARQLPAGWIELDFPAERAAPETRQALAEALGVRPLWMGRNRLHFLLELEDEQAVRGARPDARRLTAVLPPARGVIVTARSTGGDGYDFVSRFFAPGMGIHEDQATGSAHCALGPYWAAKLGKTEMAAFQASPRGGTLRVRVAGERVHLAGQAVCLMRAELVAA